MKRIAVLMRAQREQHNLNQADYGKRIGLSQAQISKLEAGTLRVLTVYVANVLERQFGELPSLKDDEVVVRMVEHYQTWERDQLTTLTAADCREIIDGLGHMVRIMAKQRQEQSDAPLAPVDPGMLRPGTRTADYEARSHKQKKPRKVKPETTEQGSH